MRYYSLNGDAPFADFKTAVLNGLAEDKGLYFPETIPMLDHHILQSFQSLSLPEIAFHFMRHYVKDVIPEKVLHDITQEAIDFPIPLVKLDEHLHVTELFHGNTLAFKDVGARFMSRCMGYFVKDIQRPLTVLVATSGDTGGAVADGFLGVEGVEVVILYPKGRVSAVQEKQLTALGQNIRAVAVNGSFDDCQMLVKQAFADTALRAKLFLTSANSINVARWLPQQLFYFAALQQLSDDGAKPVMIVPSGNFGNICAGLLAMKSGLPVSHFVAACNANQVVPDYLRTGNYVPHQSVATLSNAMDVGDPSNFIRIRELFSKDIVQLKQVMSAYSISDEETKQTILSLLDSYQYLADPHTAVGVAAFERYRQLHPNANGIIMSTAHPIKFASELSGFVDEPIVMPPNIQDLMQKASKFTEMEVDYSALRDLLCE